jgi:hypothetical protein
MSSPTLGSLRARKLSKTFKEDYKATWHYKRHVYTGLP